MHHVQLRQVNTTRDSSSSVQGVTGEHEAMDTSYLQWRDHRYSTLCPPPLPPKKKAASVAEAPSHPSPATIMMTMTPNTAPTISAPPVTTMRSLSGSAELGVGWPGRGLHFPKPALRPPSLPLSVCGSASSPSPVSSSTPILTTTTLDEGHVHPSALRSRTSHDPPLKTDDNDEDEEEEDDRPLLRFTLAPDRDADQHGRGKETIGQEAKQKGQTTEQEVGAGDTETPSEHGESNRMKPLPRRPRRERRATAMAGPHNDASAFGETSDAAEETRTGLCRRSLEGVDDGVRQIRQRGGTETTVHRWQSLLRELMTCDGTSPVSPQPPPPPQQQQQQQRLVASALQNNLGALLRRASRFREASSHLASAWQMLQLAVSSAEPSKTSAAAAAAAAAPTGRQSSALLPRGFALCENIGHLYHAVGDHARALDFYERGLRLYEALYGIPDRNTWQVPPSSFSASGESVDDTRKVSACYLAAYCRCLSGYASAKDVLGHLAEAMTFHDLALAHHRRLPADAIHATRNVVRLNVSSSLLNNGQLLLGMASLRRLDALLDQEKGKVQETGRDPEDEENVALQAEIGTRMRRALMELHRVTALLSINQEKSKLEWRREAKTHSSKGRIQQLIDHQRHRPLHVRRDSTATKHSIGAKSMDLHAATPVPSTTTISTAHHRATSQKKLSFTRGSDRQNANMHHGALGVSMVPPPQQQEQAGAVVPAPSAASKLRSKSMDNLKAFQAPLMSLKHHQLHHVPSFATLSQDEAALNTGALFMRKTIEMNIGVLPGLEYYPLFAAAAASAKKKAPQAEETATLQALLASSFRLLRDRTDAGDTAGMCHAQLDVGYLCIGLNSLSQSTMYFEAALRLATGRAHKQDQIHCHYALGLAALLKQDLYGAYAAFASAYQDADALHDPYWIGRLRFVMADTMECVLVCVEENGSCALSMTSNQADERRHLAALRAEIMTKGGTCHVAELRQQCHDSLLMVLGWCDACYRSYSYPTLQQQQQQVQQQQHQSTFARHQSVDSSPSIIVADLYPPPSAQRTVAPSSVPHADESNSADSTPLNASSAWESDAKERPQVPSSPPTGLHIGDPCQHHRLRQKFRLSH